MSVHAPLSGDVSQAINPWSWWFGTLGQQLGLVNVNLQRSGDPEIERRIVQDVASYGRQLGWIVDALQVVVSRVDPVTLTPAEHQAVAQLADLQRRVGEVKGERRESTSAAAERVIAETRALEATDPDEYRRIVERLRTAFG